MPSTLYGINRKNELTVVKEYQNSFSACYHAWDYFEKKYFNKNVGLKVFGIFENEEKAVMAGDRLSEIGGFELVEVTRCQGLE